MGHGALKVVVQYQTSTAVGLTNVASRARLPKWATAIVAAFKKEGEPVAGNVIQFDAINKLIGLGVSSAVVPIQPAKLQRIELAATVLVAIRLLAWTRRRMRFTCFRKACFFAYTGLLHIHFLILK
jgi:Ca2+/Na+ antiporter